ncbi:MAG TPA: hypothetical protein VEQ59_20405 [Polyangiaceae bacterium]|nr:hypothetical protein [Polyangiaceae bacterium]
MRPCGFWLVLLACAAPFGCSAKPRAVACTCTYGGQAQRLLFAPTTDPYRVAARDVGARFRFKAVYLREPWLAASINVYVYARDEDRDVLLQEGKYAPPFAASGGRFGFTGKQLVYSSEQRELEYWCELSP